MTADSSTVTVTNSGDGGVNSPSRRRNLPSAWAQVVRGGGGGGEPESVIPRSPGVSEQHSVFSDQLMVFEPASVVVAAAVAVAEAAPPDGDAGGVKKSVWKKPSANGVVEGITTSTTTTITPVMGAASWPALSESTRPVQKSLSSSESSSKATADGLVTVLEAPVISQTQQKPARTNANNHSNTTNNHPFRQQRSMKRGGSASAGYSRPPPPPPPPLPPPFPLFDMTYCNYVPPVLDSPIRDQPPLKGNSWNPRPMGVVHDHSSNRTPSRRNNFGPRPRGDGGIHNNGYGGRNEHHNDRDWRGTRSPAGRDVHGPQPIVPPPPRGYFRPPYMGAQPIRPYGTPMGYEMAAPFVYVPTLPPEPYRGAPLLPQAAPPPMFIPVMDPPLHVLILNQIEYYFSDANLVKDNFLRSNMDEEGWVPIALIAGFRRVQNLTTDVQIILNSLRDSSSVEIQGDKVRRRIEWRKWVQSADFSADSTSQSPRETTNSSVDEISIQTLKLEELATENIISNPIEDVDHKEEAPQLTDSSKLANGEVSLIEEARSSHI